MNRCGCLVTVAGVSDSSLSIAGFDYDEGEQPRRLGRLTDPARIKGSLRGKEEWKGRDGEQIPQLTQQCSPWPPSR